MRFQHGPSQDDLLRIVKEHKPVATNVPSVFSGLFTSKMQSMTGCSYCYRHATHLAFEVHEVNDYGEDGFVIYGCDQHKVKDRIVRKDGTVEQVQQ